MLAYRKHNATAVHRSCGCAVVQSHVVGWHITHKLTIDNFRSCNIHSIYVYTCMSDCVWTEHFICERVACALFGAVNIRHYLRSILSGSVLFAIASQMTKGESYRCKILSFFHKVSVRLKRIGSWQHKHSNNLSMGYIYLWETWSVYFMRPLVRSSCVMYLRTFHSHNGYCYISPISPAKWSV